MARKTPQNSSDKARGIQHGYRSGLEERIARELQDADVPFEFEEHKLEYMRPAKKSKYTPDFLIHTRTGKQIFVETKGRFLTADRQKHLLIKDQHPDVDIRFVFSNAYQRISKQSKTTYAMWCEKNNFKYANCHVPVEWIEE